MLLIGDIHITTKHTESIIDTIRSYIAHFPDEQNIIFLGDYMYMFSYDRKALGRLFDLFLALWQEGKNVYILAGNHDRIGQQFVYAEWKKIADMLGQKSQNSIRFITSPEIHTIENKEIFFFPFSKHISIPDRIDDHDISPIVKSLLASKNSNERLSGEINMIVDGYRKKYKDLTIIHHYYIADTRFPGQKALFNYKDIALAPDLLHDENIRLISGHIHMPFAYKNYLCTGSVRYTSPLETDHHKFLWQWDTKSDSITGQQ
jgi:predicted phosphodiesterase